MFQHIDVKDFCLNIPRLVNENSLSAAMKGAIRLHLPVILEAAALDLDIMRTASLECTSLPCTWFPHIGGGE
jgi:hypothetical protein